LAEQIAWATETRVVTLIPMIVKPTPGFVLSPQPWSDDDAAHHTREDCSDADYAVVTHLVAETEPWTMDMRLIRTIDASCIGHFQVSFQSDAPENGIPKLAELLLSLVAEHDIAARQA